MSRSKSITCTVCGEKSSPFVRSIDEWGYMIGFSDELPMPSYEVIAHEIRAIAETVPTDVDFGDYKSLPMACVKPILIGEAVNTVYRSEKGADLFDCVEQLYTFGIFLSRNGAEFLSFCPDCADEQTQLVRSES